MPDARASGQQSRRFLWLYALAWAGGAIAYVPFLTLLLPQRVSEIAGAQSVDWLSYIAFSGAIAASFGGIFFGWLSDLTKWRTPWIWAGLALSSVLLLLTLLAETLPVLVVAVACWQLSLNMMLAPMAAWAGDTVPDGQKGVLGGLLAFAPALGALSGALVTIPGLAGGPARLGFVAGLVALAVLPALLIGKPRAFPHLMAPPERAAPDRDPKAVSSPVLRMWIARFLVQISEAALFAFLLLWFRSLDAAITENRTANIFGFVLLAAVPATLLIGRWADRAARPVLPLAACALVSASGLLVMALSQTVPLAIAGYVLFAFAAAIFLSLHSAQTLRFLPQPGRRGRDLGIFNLTNTTPSLVMPWLTLALVPVFGFSALFLVLAGLSVVAALVLLSLVSRG